MLQAQQTRMGGYQKELLKAHSARQTFKGTNMARGINWAALTALLLPGDLIVSGQPHSLAFAEGTA